MRDLAALLRLNPLRPEAVLSTPLLEHRPQADDVEERLLAHHASDGRAVVRVEVAVDRYAARFGERDRLLDLAALKVPFAHRCRWDGTRRACTDAAHAQVPG